MLQIFKHYIGEYMKPSVVSWSEIFLGILAMQCCDIKDFNLNSF